MPPKKQLAICMLSTMYLRYPGDTRGLMVAELNRILKSGEHRIHVVAPDDGIAPRTERMDGIDVHRFRYCTIRKWQRLAYGSGIPTNLRNSFFAKLQVIPFTCSYLWKTLKIAKRCDLIHCQWLFSGLIGIIAGKLLGKPVVVQVRRANHRGIFRQLNRFVLTHADHVIYNSSFTKKSCEQLARPKAATIIHNTIDTKRFKPGTQVALKKGLGLMGKNIIFTMGLLVEKKGFTYLLQAMPAVLKKHHDTCLLIAGEGALWTELHDQARRLGIDNNVHFLGTVSADQTPKYHQLADVFVLPSIVDSRGETETLGVVLLEAMASGKPVVASRVGGIPDAVDEKTSILVKPKDPVAIAAAIDALLKDTSRRLAMGGAGRTRMVKKFSGTSLLSDYQHIYSAIASQRRPGR